MKIAHDDRLALLKAHNDLKDILQTIYDCQDIWMSDVGKLESMYCDLHRIFKFVPKEDEDGNVCKMQIGCWQRMTTNVC